MTFYTVRDNASKLRLICSKAMESFQAEKRLLISTPSFDAAKYVESLLWRSPEDSFMPHVISDTATKEWIAITLQDQANVNQAAVLLNLRPEFPALAHLVDEVYELYDATHPQKIECSENRKKEYLRHGFTVHSL